jgi:16S rRNA G966 N2-methylase RsmD
MINYLPRPDEGTETIVEPFAGSLAFSLSYDVRNIIAAESNEAIRELLLWLHQTATEQRLQELQELEISQKVDVRELPGLCSEERTLLRLQMASLVVGQLSSWTLYPQHSKGLDKVVSQLQSFKSKNFQLFRHFKDIIFPSNCSFDNTLVFVDPPYLNTDGNYKDKGRDFGQVEPEDIEDWISELPYKVLFTYGNGAQDLFPRYQWQVAMNRKVPDMRNGGSKERTEWFAKINW